MNKILYFLSVIIIAIILIGCSDEPPSVRVSNERSNKANVQIKTVSNTINQNDVNGGAITNYQDVPEGKIDVTAVIQNESVSATTAFNASNDNNYTVIILNGNPPTLKVNASGK